MIKNLQQYHLSLAMENNHFQYTHFHLPSFSFRIGSRIKSFHVTQNDILAIVKTLDPNKAHGCDNVSIKMIKICGQSFVLPLKIIFKHSFKGKFAEIWKRQM